MKRELRSSYLGVKDMFLLVIPFNLLAGENRMDLVNTRLHFHFIYQESWMTYPWTEPNTLRLRNSCLIDLYNLCVCDCNIEVKYCESKSRQPRRIHRDLFCKLNQVICIKVMLSFSVPP